MTSRKPSSGVTALFLVAAAFFASREAGAQRARAACSHHHRHARVNLASYRAHVRSWHDASTSPPSAHTPDGQLVLRLYSINTHARVEAAPAPQGSAERFDQAARDQIALVLGDPRHHTTHEIDPRLVDALYNVAQHFDACEIRVISGYRAGSRHSNHSLGRAVDFIVPGVSDSQVAQFSRSLGEVGVGEYPVSGFVHLDVRDRATSWVDTSGPGAPAHYRHHHHHHHHPDARASRDVVAVRAQ